MGTSHAHATSSEHVEGSEPVILFPKVDLKNVSPNRIRFVWHAQKDVDKIQLIRTLNTQQTKGSQKQIYSDNQHQKIIKKTTFPFLHNDTQKRCWKELILGRDFSDSSALDTRRIKKAKVWDIEILQRKELKGHDVFIRACKRKKEKELASNKTCWQKTKQQQLCLKVAFYTDALQEKNSLSRCHSRMPEFSPINFRTPKEIITQEKLPISQIEVQWRIYSI